MNYPPKISVIIPNYNHERYLIQRIESVLQQTYSNIEILILDDCSIDNSYEIIEKYVAQDVRIKVVYNEKNSGSTFKQWNKGIALAKGRYIWIAESDDYAAIHLLEKLVDVMESDDTIGLAYCNSLNVDENNKILSDNSDFYNYLDVSLWKNDFVKDGKELVLNYMSYRNIIPNASAVLLRKSVVNQVGPADETKRLNGDWLYWMSVLAVCKVAYIAEPLNFFRHHTQNVRSSTSKTGVALSEMIDVLRRIKQYGEPNATSYNNGVNFIYWLWFDNLPEGGLPFKKHFEIYKGLLKLRVGVNGRLLRYLFHNRRDILKRQFSFIKK